MLIKGNTSNVFLEQIQFFFSDFEETAEKERRKQIKTILLHVQRQMWIIY